MPIKQKPVSVVIAHSQKDFRGLIQTLLREVMKLHLLGEAFTTGRLLKLCRLSEPHLIVTGIKLLDANFCSKARDLKKEFPDVQIIAIGTNYSKTELIKLAGAGVRAHVYKPSLAEELPVAVKTILTGGVYYSPHLNRMIFRIIADRTFGDEAVKTEIKGDKNHWKIYLSSMEIEVIRLICVGFTNQEIAVDLARSKRTIEDIRFTIMKKTGTKNTAGIVLYAIKKGIFEIDQPG